MSTLIKVYGTIDAPDGFPACGGCLAFIPTIVAWKDASVTPGIRVVGRPVYVRLDVLGYFETTLQAVDDANITPHTGWTYTVVEQIPGVIQRVWTGFAPVVANLAAGIDYTTVAPAP